MEESGAARPAGDELLLALDVGTQSARALLFDLAGALIDKAQVPLDIYRSPKPGWHECDAEAVWDKLTEACRRLWVARPYERERIRGVALTTQRGTVVPVDAEARPLAPAITWLDQRRAVHPARMPLHWRAAFAVSGAGKVFRRFAREAEARWLADNMPETLERAHKYLLLSGYLHRKLTGRFVDSVGAQVGFIPFDYKRQRWAADGDWRWPALSLRPEQMPDLAPVGAQLGTICAEAATATGIPVDLPVIAAAADKASGNLGSGSLSQNVGAISYGTTATIAIRSPRYFEAVPLGPAYPSAAPGLWDCEVQIFRGYWMVGWFRDEFADREKAEAARRNITPESLFDELVDSAPPGALGLTLQPYWTPGVSFPPSAAKGAIIGFGDAHGRAHIYRAILEGMAYALRDGCERIETKSGVKMTELRVSGGGAQSDAALQITADVFALPTGRPHTVETAGLGAAIACAVGLGLYADFDAATAAMTRVARWFAPDRDRIELYDALYRQVYQRMYPRLAPLYAAIQRITGYPEVL